MVDLRALKSVLQGPDNDTRTWFTHGIIDGSNDADADDACVDFSAGYPIVRVMTQPDQVPISCRVGMAMAGNGEAEWHPFLVGDEVGVAIPDGNYRNGGIIIARLNNEIDRFPTESVGGQDPTKNNFAFRRTRTPVIEEQAGPWTKRDALTGCLLSLDETGAVTIRAGNPGAPTEPASAIKVSHDILGMQNPDGTVFLQLNLVDDNFTVRVKDVVATLASGTAAESLVTVPRTFTLGNSGNPPLEHVVTTEAVVSIVMALLNVMSVGFAAIPATVGGAPGGIPFAAVLTALTTAGLAPVIAAAGTLTPPALAAIQGVFAAAAPKPNTPTGQLVPGIGCPGFLTG